MRVGDLIYASRRVGPSESLVFTVRDITSTMDSYGERSYNYQVECQRCGQRQVMGSNNDFVQASASDWTLDLSTMPNSAFRNRIMGHNSRCWERSYSSSGPLPFPIYGSVDCVSCTSPGGLVEDGVVNETPIRIRVDEYGEQFIERVTVQSAAREAVNAVKEAVQEITKPFTKVERDKKKHIQLKHQDLRLIRED